VSLKAKKKGLSLEFESLEPVLRRIGHSEPVLEWLNAPDAYEVYADIIVQDLLDDPEVGEFLAWLIAQHRYKQMLRYLSAMDAAELLINASIIAEAKEARIEHTKERKRK